MKITLYTVETCKFSAEEREYLTSKNLPFEQHDVEKDHAALEEMLKIGNNFAGTPVTNIEKDDKTNVVLKGFTKEEFEKELFPQPAESEKPMDATVKPAAAVAPAPVTAGDIPPVPPAPPQDPNAPGASSVPVAPGTLTPNPLDSILQDLQSKIPPPTLGNQSSTTPPNAPAPIDPNAPMAPDFPKTQ